MVYQFSRTEVGCQATYSQTACTLWKRSSQHKYSISVIHKHYINDHLLLCLPVNFSDNCMVLQNFPDICELRIAEAILRKKKLPIINVKYNKMYNSIKRIQVILELGCMLPLFFCFVCFDCDCAVHNFWGAAVCISV